MTASPAMNPVPHLARALLYRHPEAFCSANGEEGAIMVFIVLWLLGVPLGLIVLLWLLGVFA